MLTKLFMFILIVLIPVQNMRFNDVNHSRKPDQPIVNPINKIPSQSADFLPAPHASSLFVARCYK